MLPAKSFPIAWGSKERPLPQYAGFALLAALAALSKATRFGVYFLIPTLGAFLITYLGVVTNQHFGLLSLLSLWAGIGLFVLMRYLDRRLTNAGSR